MNYDIIVIGGGPSGMTSAIYSSRGGWKTILFDPMGGGGQAGSTDRVWNYPGFPEGVGGAELMDLMSRQAEAFGTKIEWEAVDGIVATDGSFLVKAGKEEYTAKAVIYAAGTVPNKLGVPGEQEYMGKGISFCATCDGPLFRGKTVAVVGGGNSALSEAEFLSRFAEEVILIHRRHEFRASPATVLRVKANPKITMRLGSVVDEIRGDDFVTSILVRDLETGAGVSVPVDGLFLYVGWSPNTGPISGLVDTGEGGYVLAGEDMSTRTPGLFVAGDVRNKALRQIATAVGDGATAAWAAEKFLIENRM